jgi:CBS domain-containing protein
MAGQRDCCRTPQEWRSAFGGWVDEATPEGILAFNTHVDFRPLMCNRELAASLRDYVTERALGDQIFQRLLAEDALRHTPPLNWLGQLAEDDRGAIDLKLHGTLPFTDAVRVLALAAGVDATSTVERLQDATPILRLDPKSVQAWEDAFQFLQLLRLRHQHRLRDIPEEDVAERRRANQIDPDTLSTVDRRILKESFRQIRKLQQRLRVEFAIAGA